MSEENEEVNVAVDPLYLAKIVFYLSASKFLLDKEKREDLINKFNEILPKLNVIAKHFKEVAEGSILALLGYMGLTTLPFHPFLAVLWGPIGLKLATTSGGYGHISLGFKGLGVKIPVNSQIAGLIMLSMLGFYTLPWEELEKWWVWWMRELAKEKPIIQKNLASKIISKRFFGGVPYG